MTIRFWPLLWVIEGGQEPYGPNRLAWNRLKRRSFVHYYITGIEPEWFRILRVGGAIISEMEDGPDKDNLRSLWVRVAVEIDRKWVNQ